MAVNVFGGGGSLTVENAVSKEELLVSLGTRVARAGDSMSGALRMGNSRIEELASPADGADSATKAYVDSSATDRVARAGDTMAGELSMGSNRLTNLGAPTAGTDSATKAYVDSSVTDRVARAGDAMTGNLSMGGSRVTDLGLPAADGDSVNKGYVDAETGVRISRFGDTMFGDLTMSGNEITSLGEATQPTSAVRKQYVDDLGRLTGVDEKTLPPLTVQVVATKTLSISPFAAYFAENLSAASSVKYATSSTFVVPDSAFTQAKLVVLSTLSTTLGGGFAVDENVLPDPNNPAKCRLAILSTAPPDSLTVLSVAPNLSRSSWYERLTTLTNGQSFVVSDYVARTVTREAGSVVSEGAAFPTATPNYKTFAEQLTASMRHVILNVVQSTTTDFLRASGVLKYNAAKTALEAVPNNSWTVMYHIVGDQSNTNFMAYTGVDEAAVNPADYIAVWKQLIAATDPVLLEGNTLRTVFAIKGSYTTSPADVLLASADASLQLVRTPT